MEIQQIMAETETDMLHNYTERILNATVTPVLQIYTTEYMFPNPLPHL
jgi:hypothetical protein